MFKVATWNVNSIKARLERVIAFVRRENPAVLCLQELKCLDEAFPVGAFADLGYHSAVWGQRTYNGVAILARSEITDVVRGFEDDGESASRFIAVTVDGVRIASAYIPNGQKVGTDKFAYKLEWFHRLRRFLDDNMSARDPFLLAGDFNVAPADRDVHDPLAWRDQVLFSDPEKQALREVCAFGLYDTFRKLHPDDAAYSWWDYRQLAFVKNRGLRIDFILSTAPLLERLRAARIDRNERKGTGASDHAPVIAEFEVELHDAR